MSKKIKKIPLNNKCLVESVIYKATITSDNETKNYLGSTGGTFKKDGTTISVILKTRNKTAQKYQNTSGNLKLTTLVIK